MTPFDRIAPARCHRIVAGLGIALVLLLDVLAVCPEAHEWFHHDADQDAHECVVTHFLHGSTPPLENVPLVVEPIPRPSDEAPSLVALIAPEAPAFFLPPGCGPPTN